MEKAVSKANNDDHDKSTTNEIRTHSMSITPAEGHTILSPNSPQARDDNALTIDWDGPDDPENPRNWTFKQKWEVIISMSAFMFIIPISSSMIAPASRQLAERFDIHSTVLLAMTTSAFAFAFIIAFGPLFLGPLSEIYGRSHVLRIPNLWYLIWNTACGFARSKNELIAFRFLAGLGGSAILAIGGAVIGDLFDAERRGQAMSIYSLGALLGPVIGPVAGAWIAEKSTWHWVFWSTSIVDAMIQGLGIRFMKETYPPVLLERKAVAIRKAMDEEKALGMPICISMEIADRHWRAMFSKRLIRPFRLFIHEPIVQLLGFYMAYVFGIIYIFITTISSIFQDVYHDRLGIAGFHYLAFGVGVTVGYQINARYMDRVYKFLKSRNGGVGKPEFRLPNIVPGTILLPIGLLISGWTAQIRVFWLVPDIGIALVGAGTMVVFQNIQTYVIDSFTLHSASAFAAIAFLRSLAGFGFPLFAPTIYKSLGYGKGNTILAIVAIVVGCPAPWLFWFYGERIRNASRYAHKGHS